MKAGKHLNLGFPIAEVGSAGDCVIAKQKDTRGVVNTETTASQLVYEISGPWYYKSDVVALLEDVKAEGSSIGGGYEVRRSEQLNNVIIIGEKTCAFALLFKIDTT